MIARKICQFKNYRLDYVVTLMIGLGVLICFYRASFPHLSWSDEIVYAVMGRNIATGRGIISNFYHPLSVIEKGYPLPDVHMPGYSLVLSLSFRLLGQREYAAFFPNHIAYLVTGLLLFQTGKSLFNRWTGFGAAVGFYLFPAVVIYTHTAMSELTLTLLSVIFLAVWCQNLTAPRLFYSVMLAVSLGAGLLHRESFLIFLLPVLYTLWHWPKQDRLKAWLYFGVVFVILFGALFLPLYLARAPYPHVLSALLAAPDVTTVLVNNLLVNLNLLQGLSQFRPDGQTLSFQYHLIFILVIAVFYFRLTGFQKKIYVYALLTLAGSTLLFFVIYLVTYRQVMHLLPPLLLLVAGLMSQVKPAGLKYGFAVIAVGFLGYSSLLVTRDMARDRQREFESGMVYANAIAKLSDENQPELVFSDSDNIFLYGWIYYPVAVIWSLEPEGCTNLKLFQQLLERLPVQIIAVKDACYQNQIQVATREKLLPITYIFRGEESGYYIFLSAGHSQ